MGYWRASARRWGPNRPSKRGTAMKARWCALGVAVLTLALGGEIARVGAQQPASAKPSAPAARVGDEVIMLEEVERAVQPQLAKLEEQRYEVLDQKLEQLIAERLLSQEAKRRNVSVEELIKTEVYSKAPEVPESDVTAFIKQTRDRLPTMDDQELRMTVWEAM